MFIMDKKIELRKYLKKQRSSLSMEQVLTSSLQISRHILACDAYLQAKCIMGYLAFGNELSVDLVLKQALKDGKIVTVPYIISSTEMQAVVLKNMQDLVFDCYGIRTVSNYDTIIPPQNHELILVPGVSFGYDGSRLGMGAGYYDRFLSKARGVSLMGVAYDKLMQKTLPCTQYDVGMNFLVSENGIISVTKF